jgi:hypothetical protein
MEKIGVEQIKDPERHSMTERASIVWEAVKARHPSAKLINIATSGAQLDHKRPMSSYLETWELFYTYEE